jgi:hypothetical protein
MGLIRNLQLAMQNIDRIASAADAIVNVAAGAVPAASSNPALLTVATDPKSVASLVALSPQTAAENVPEAKPHLSTLEKVEAVASEVAQVAEVVVPLIPGLQATALVKLLTHSTALINAVEEIKTSVQKNDPQAWAEIEHAYSSAVGAFHAVPKK